VALQEAIMLKLKKENNINVVAANSGEEALFLAKALVKEKNPIWFGWIF